MLRGQRCSSALSTGWENKEWQNALKIITWQGKLVIYTTFGTLIESQFRYILGGDSIALKCARGDAGGDDGGDVLVLGGVGGDD